MCGPIDKPARNDLHATMKPVELIVRAIDDGSERVATVLDPFGGSGSTIIACEKTGGRARLLEPDPAYVDVDNRTPAGSHRTTGRARK